jgi:methylmalonyl-CoA mutase N-terminal domain/subunit
MIDPKKFENIEDPEIKKLFEEMTEFMTPKAKEMQEKILKSGGMLKMIKAAKDFVGEMKKDYKAKYNRELDEDIVKINKYFDVNDDMMASMLKNFK